MDGNRVLLWFVIILTLGGFGVLLVFSDIGDSTFNHLDYPFKDIHAVIGWDRDAAH